MGKIFITGATGLLGSRLTQHLKDSGYEVFTHARSTGADFTFDLSDVKRTYKTLEQIQPSIIINLASITNVELCEKQVALAYLSNTNTVESLVNWVEATDTECHLVQVSTDHVYDGPGLHAEDKVTITNNYAFSKYAGELAAFRVPSTILRTNFVGRSKVSHRESLTDWVYSSLVSDKQLQVLSDVYFSPLSISFLIEMIVLVIERKQIGIYNLGSHNGMSKADFIFCFADLLKLQTNTMTRIMCSEARFLKTYRPKNMCMNISKFEIAFGVKLPYLIDLIKPLAEEYNEIT